MTLRRSYPLPEIAGSGAPLLDFVGVVIPLARTNLWTNGSFETNTTGATAVGASIARSATEQYHGTYSLAVTPSAGTNSDGAFFGSIATTSGTPYVASLKFKATSAGIGKQYAISIADTSGVDLARRVFVATGRWQWVWTPVYSEVSSTNRRIYIRKNNHSAASVFYVDGIQAESCADGVLQPTTYIDGDQLGLLVGQQPAPFQWTGTPHASTSTRSALTRAGGYVVSLQDTYRFLLTGILGLGMAVPNNVAIPYTVNDGARFQRTTKPPRTFSLTGRFQASTPQQLHRLRSDMRQAFDRDLVPVQQPLVLMVEPRDDCGPTGDFVTIPCLYAGGLEGNDTSALAEDAAPTFTAYVPFVSGGAGGASLTVQQSVANANTIVQRSSGGVWSALGTGMSGGAPLGIQAVVRGLDGTLYAGGEFTDAGGSGADYLAKWNGSSWSVVRSATAINAAVYALAVGSDGRIYAGGFFTNVDGIAAADYIAVYDPNANTWAALGTGAGSSGVLALAFDRLGNLYAGGGFSSMGGVGSTAGIARWNGSAWSSIGTVAGGTVTVNALAVDSANRLFAAGNFTSIGGTSLTRIGRWNGSAWSALGTGLNSDGLALVFGPNNILYVGGFFTSAGGTAVNYVASWNGTSFSPLGSGFDNFCYSLGLDASGVLYASGGFTTANNISLPDSMARWNGSTWLPLDIDLPGSAIAYEIYAARDGSVTIGSYNTGTATAAAITTVTNTTPNYVWPRLVINGPSSGSSRIYQIVNYTTGYGVWLNYTILAGETAIFDFDPQRQRFYTTALGYDDNGDLSHTILPGSQPALMYLAPGANTISFFAASSTVTATLSWQKRYNGTADLVN